MKFNKSIAGYHMLVLLSEVDGYFDDAEKAVVEEYIQKNFPIPINLETENKVLFISIPMKMSAFVSSISHSN